MTKSAKQESPVDILLDFKHRDKKTLSSAWRDLEEQEEASSKSEQESGLDDKGAKYHYSKLVFEKAGIAIHTYNGHITNVEKLKKH